MKRLADALDTIVSITMIIAINFPFRWEQLYGGLWRPCDEMLLTLLNLLRSLM